MGTTFGDDTNRRISAIEPFQEDALEPLVSGAKLLREASANLARLLLMPYADPSEINHVRNVYDEVLYAFNGEAYNVATTASATLIAAIVADYVRLGTAPNA